MSRYSAMNPFVSTRPVNAPIELYDDWISALQPYFEFFKLGITEAEYSLHRESYDSIVLDYTGQRFGSFTLSDRTPFYVDHFFGPDIRIFENSRYYDPEPLLKDFEKLKNIVTTTPGVNVKYLVPAFHAYNSGYNFNIKEMPRVNKNYTASECMQLLSFLKGDIDTAYGVMKHQVVIAELAKFKGLPHTELQALFSRER